MIPIIETERLTLRAPQASDLEMDAAFFASDRCFYFSKKKDLDGSFSALAYNIGHWAIKGFGLWAVDDKSSDTYFGRIGIMQMPSWDIPELGWLLINPAAEGKGIAYEASVAARDYAFDTLDMPKLQSTIRVGNDRSIKLAKRLGATYESTEEFPDHGSCDVYVHERKAA